MAAVDEYKLSDWLVRVLRKDGKDDIVLTTTGRPRITTGDNMVCIWSMGSEAWLPLAEVDRILIGTPGEFELYVRLQNADAGELRARAEELRRSGEGIVDFLIGDLVLHALEHNEAVREVHNLMLEAARREQAGEIGGRT